MSPCKSVEVSPLFMIGSCLNILKYLLIFLFRNFMLGTSVPPEPYRSLGGWRDPHSVAQHLDQGSWSSLNKKLFLICLCRLIVSFLFSHPAATVQPPQGRSRRSHSSPTAWGPAEDPFGLKNIFFQHVEKSIISKIMKHLEHSSSL